MKVNRFVVGHLEENAVYTLSDSDEELIAKARLALKSSYSVYSNFKVGAAVLLEKGDIVLGSNQENAVYPLGLCAERVAIFSAASQYPDQKIKAIAVTTERELVNYPCGSCRQVISEYENKFSSAIRVLVAGRNEVTVFESIEEILPLSFSRKSLDS